MEELVSAPMQLSCPVCGADVNLNMFLVEDDDFVKGVIEQAGITNYSLKGEAVCPEGHPIIAALTVGSSD